MDFEVIDVDLTNKSEDLSILSPYSDSPVLGGARFDFDRSKYN